MSEKINVLIGANIEGLKTALAESGKSLSDFGTLAEQTPKRAKTALDQLNQSYRDAVRDAKNLALMQGETSEAFYEAQLKAKNLKAEIEGLNIVVGQTGQIAGGSGGIQQATNKFNMLGHSVNQLTREMPAFTQSMTTGFMAISNNIPMLVDQITEIKKANAGLVASGQPVKSVFSQLGAALFSWNTAISLGITILTVYGEKLVNFFIGAKKSKEELQQMANAQQSLNDKIREYLMTDQEKALDAEAKAYKEVTDGIKARIKQTQIIKDEYGRLPDQLRLITIEQALINDKAKKDLEIAELRYQERIKEIRDTYLTNTKQNNDYEVQIHNQKLDKMLAKLAEFKRFYNELSRAGRPNETGDPNLVPDALKEEEELPFFPSKEAMESRANQHDQFLTQIEQRATEHANRMKVVNDILASSFHMVGNALGDAFATGDYGGSALKLLADFMALVGSAAIAVGTAYAAMGFTAGQGALAITAGIALIAASRVVGAKAKGGGGGGNTNTGSGTSGGGGNIPSFNPTGMRISIDGLVRGNNIVVALDNQTRMNRRVR